MLRSGFDREDEWGFRALEPSRCCISSIALVLLKTGIVHHSSEEKPVEIDATQMATAQKLLLFWRKPAVRLYYVVDYLLDGLLFISSENVGGMDWMSNFPQWMISLA